MYKIAGAGLAGLLLAMAAHAEPDALAKAFGARETVMSASLSPDGSKIAIIAAAGGRATRGYVLDAAEGATPKPIMATTGKPENLTGCDWVASDRLACKIYGTTRYADEVYSFSNILAIDAGGGNVKTLSQRRGSNALGWDFRGGSIVDLLPGQDGVVLMTRSYVPEAKIGSLVEKRQDGLGVDRIDTRSGAARRIEQPRPLAYNYISDGQGRIRVMGLWDDLQTGFKARYKFMFRMAGSDKWHELSTYDSLQNAGFWPVGVDSDKNVAYGLERVDGRDALVSITLDQDMTREVVFAHPVADVSGIVQVGRNRRIVGARYTLEHGEAVYFDPATAALVDALGKALGGKAVHMGDMSEDGQKALVWAGSDVDPGQYYLFDRATKKLAPVMPDRPELAGRTLATMKPISYKAGDGTVIPAYLTLPPGKETARGLPAMVMPHGGPDSRDQWGFDWLAQYFAARGFAVIQPQFRGSYGFGEQWLMDTGFRSWRTSVGDVADAGRWLVAEGIADPARLTILGWSYGGYAALQAQAIDPTLFKAVVAIAPVTDIGDRLRRARSDGSYYVERARLGSGPEAEDASPVNHVDKFQAPVLMFHGTADRNVDVSQAKIMESKLRGAGKRSELVIYEDLEHSLVDSDVRADMLQKSSDFLLAAGR
ncbi:putative S9 family peptidase [Sphingobium sp. SYK-6]|uniref:alpha/beta hydrolase family protein n=1 Tax=Sphingobium sp. (strain NBRC 103272 / SYK-6) TaxID=627192 RepID=UPI0002277313|nr:alpha/beta fold hydrolase [Sphingobium sp. SYK-6]BAK67658.1 putative S9 family peptidase [Sphingobium sp. SYK-6]